MKLYNIIRFNKNKPNRIIKRGVTLEEAQCHCKCTDTKGTDWFDGYRGA